MLNETVLNPQQELFCQEYLVDLNATQAALRAGYSENSARQIGSENLSKPYIQDRIATLCQARIKRVVLNQDNVLLELIKLANSDLRELFNQETGALLPIKEWPDHIAACVASFEVEELFEGSGKDKMQIGFTKKVRFWDKTKSLELLGKHLKLFSDRLELSGNKDNPISIEHSTLSKEQVDEKIRILLEKRKLREIE